jgi:hypothetical protein
MALRWARRCRWPVGGMWLQMADCWARRCRWPDGGMWLQMADCWARRCRWPVGGMWLQMADCWARRCRWPVGSLSLQMADCWARRCRWPAGSLSLQMASWLPIAADSPAGTASSRRSRWGSAPNPADGAPTPSALPHGKMGSIGPLPTGEITASEGRLSPPNEAVTLPTCWRGRRFGLRRGTRLSKIISNQRRVSPRQEPAAKRQQVGSVPGSVGPDNRASEAVTWLVGSGPIEPTLPCVSPDGVGAPSGGFGAQPHRDRREDAVPAGLSAASCPAVGHLQQ